MGLNSRKTRIQEGREDSRKDRDETKSFMGEIHKAIDGNAYAGIDDGPNGKNG